MDMAERIATVLRALAVGDALGRVTEGYTPAEIIEVYEDIVTDFVEPIRLFDAEAWAEGETGPPTQILLEAAASGGRWQGAGGGDVAQLPAAIALGTVLRLADILGGGERIDEPSHAAVAAGLAAALEGRPATEVVAAGSRAARNAGAPALAESILRAAGVAQATGGERPGPALGAQFPPAGDSETVTAFVFGIVYGTQSARRAIVEAVNQGGNAPETAGIAGALCAALAPASFPAPWGWEIERRNQLDLARAARQLAVARQHTQ